MVKLAETRKYGKLLAITNPEGKRVFPKSEESLVPEEREQPVGVVTINSSCS